MKLATMPTHERMREPASMILYLRGLCPSETWTLETGGARCDCGYFHRGLVSIEQYRNKHRRPGRLRRIGIALNTLIVALLAQRGRAAR